MHHNAAVNFDIFRGRRTMATARPSGTLWTAREAEMKTPNSDPFDPPNETPMPIPSLKEWRVMTKMMSNTFLASAPASPATFRSSCFSRNDLVERMKRSPRIDPMAVRDSGEREDVSSSSVKLIPSMTRE